MVVMRGLVSLLVLAAVLVAVSSSRAGLSAEEHAALKAKLAATLQSRALHADPIVTPSHMAVPKSTYTPSAAGPVADDHKPESPNMAAECAECKEFLSALTGLVKAHGVQSADYRQGEEHVKATNNMHHSLCSNLPEKFTHECQTVAQMYGLDNVLEFAVAAPDLLCEPLNACAPHLRFLHKSQVSQELDDVGDVLIGASVADTVTAGAQTGTHTKFLGAIGKGLKGAANTMLGAMKMMMAQRLYSMMNMKMMQDQQMGEQLVHQMMSKLISAQSRNREIKLEYLHFMKEAYRNQPGNCDCCDACLAPKKE